MKAFVINLDKDTKRLKNFNTHFKNSMFNIERINGVYGKDVKDNELSYICKSMCTDSMKGCAASHRYIWNNIVNNNTDIAIVFEDDAYPVVKDYEQKIQNILAEVPKDFDIINLTHSGYNINPIYNQFLKLLGLYNYNFKRISKTICIPEFTTALSSYIISLSGAKKILKILPKITGHIDSAVFSQYNKLNIYATTEYIFTQKFEKSNNCKESFLSYFIPDTYFKNFFKLSQLLYTNNFKILGKSISLSDVIWCIIFLLITSIFFKNKYIFICGSISIIFLYVLLLKITLTP